MPGAAVVYFEVRIGEVLPSFWNGNFERGIEAKIVPVAVPAVLPLLTSNLKLGVEAIDPNSIIH